MKQHGKTTEDPKNDRLSLDSFLKWQRQYEELTFGRENVFNLNQKKLLFHVFNRSMTRELDREELYDFFTSVVTQE